MKNFLIAIFCLFISHTSVAGLLSVEIEYHSSTLPSTPTIKVVGQVLNYVETWNEAETEIDFIEERVQSSMDLGEYPYTLTPLENGNTLVSFMIEEELLEENAISSISFSGNSGCQNGHFPVSYPLGSVLYGSILNLCPDYSTTFIFTFPLFGVKTISSGHVGNTNASKAAAITSLLTSLGAGTTACFGTCLIPVNDCMPVDISLRTGSASLTLDFADTNANGIPDTYKVTGTGRSISTYKLPISAGISFRRSPIVPATTVASMEVTCECRRPSGAN